MFTKLLNCFTTPLLDSLYMVFAPVLHYTAGYMIIPPDRQTATAMTHYQLKITFLGQALRKFILGVLTKKNMF